MSAPRYSSSNYDNAATRYEELANKYTGLNGLQKATENASMSAKSASEAAGASATNQALNAGYSRAKAAMKGANASANAFNSNFDQSYQRAAGMNSARLSAQQNLLNGEQHKDDQKYGAKGNQYSAGMGMANGAMQTAGAVAGAMMVSDEDAKDFTVEAGAGGNPDNRLLEDMAKLSALDFTYKPEVQAEHSGSNGVDAAEHIGVSAQELAANPVTEGCVTEDGDGNKVLDTRHLTAANTAVLAEMSRRILEIEKKIEELEARG